MDGKKKKKFPSQYSSWELASFGSLSKWLIFHIISRRDWWCKTTTLPVDPITPLTAASERLSDLWECEDGKLSVVSTLLSPRVFLDKLKERERFPLNVTIHDYIIHSRRPLHLRVKQLWSVFDLLHLPSSHKQLTISKRPLNGRCRSNCLSDYCHIKCIIATLAFRCRRGRWGHNIDCRV